MAWLCEVALVKWRLWSGLCELALVKWRLWSGLCELAFVKWRLWCGLCYYSKSVLIRLLLIRPINSLEICYHIKKIPLLVPILCQLSPVKILKLHFLYLSAIRLSTHSQLTFLKPHTSCISPPACRCHMPCISPGLVSLSLM